MALDPDGTNDYVAAGEAALGGSKNRRMLDQA
ncbi:hypothetical protein Ct9H90mP12_0080 [bacterium]|nr:MAG: hypothetical protein Ct9H90mP12_0080 [bacterium]